MNKKIVILIAIISILVFANISFAFNDNSSIIDRTIDSNATLIEVDMGKTIIFECDKTEAMKNWEICTGRYGYMECFKCKDEKWKFDQRKTDNLNMQN